MNILCVTQRFYPAIGGAENLIKTYLDFLCLKHKITVFTSDSLSIDSFWNETKSSIPKIELDYEVKRFHIITPSNIPHNKNSQIFPLQTNYPGPFMPDLWNELLSKNLKCDLIITSAFPYDQIIPAFVAAKKWNIPILVIPLIHDEFPELFMTGMRLSLLSQADGILVLSKQEKNLLIKLGLKNSKIHIIKPYIKTQILNKNQVTLFRDKYKIKNEKLILFTGLKSYGKGIITLLDSMKKIWKTNKDIILILVGPSTKEYRQYFSKLPKNFRNNIIDLEIADDLTKELAFDVCDLFILPSKSESFGLVIIEAWVHKKPVIGCKISVTQELINHLKNGILVPFGDVEGLYHEIIKILKNESLASEIGKNGFEKSKQYTTSKNLEEFEKLCYEIANLKQPI